MKRSFYTVDGVIVAERTSAGRIDYATDALGSVTGALVSNQLANTYAYKPYGALLAQSGSGMTPKQQWVGGWAIGQPADRKAITTSGPGTTAQRLAGGPRWIRCGRAFIPMATAEGRQRP
jgi:hypothetical protein